MKFYKQNIVQKVRLDRQKGFSIKSLAEKYSIPDSTISRWVRDLPGTHFNFVSAKSKVASHTELFSGTVNALKIDKSTARILASILYWCEGAKYPSSNFVSFANSDWTMSKTFLSLLRLGFEIDETKLRATLQLHTTHNISETTKFWSTLLGIPSSQFYKPTVTKPTNRMKRLDYKGTCTIRYYDSKLLHNITGIYQAFGKRTI